MKIKVYNLPDKQLHVFWCPGCRQTHSFDMRDWKVEPGENGPTYSPSLKYDDCHLNLRNGVIYYDGDCKHELAKQDVPLVDF